MVSHVWPYLPFIQGIGSSDLAQRLKEIHDAKKSDQEGLLIIVVWLNSFISQICHNITTWSRFWFEVVNYGWGKAFPIIIIS